MSGCLRYFGSYLCQQKAVDLCCTIPVLFYYTIINASSAPFSLQNKKNQLHILQLYLDGFFIYVLFHCVGPPAFSALIHLVSIFSSVESGCSRILSWVNPIGGIHLKCQKVMKIMLIHLALSCHCDSFNAWPCSLKQWCNKSRQNYHLKIGAKCVLLTCSLEEV